jgi:hypothetical protein
MWSDATTMIIHVAHRYNLSALVVAVRHITLQRLLRNVARRYNHCSVMWCTATTVVAVRQIF